REPARPLRPPPRGGAPRTGRGGRLMAAVPGAGRGPLRPRIPGAQSTVGIADRVTDRVAGRATGRVTPGVNGASTGVARPSERARALPSGWGVARRRISNTMIVAVAMLTVAT